MKKPQALLGEDFPGTGTQAALSLPPAEESPAKPPRSGVPRAGGSVWEPCQPAECWGSPARVQVSLRHCPELPPALPRAPGTTEAAVGAVAALMLCWMQILRGTTPMLSRSSSVAFNGEMQSGRKCLWFQLQKFLRKTDALVSTRTRMSETKQKEE